MPHTSKPDGALPGETVCDLAPPRLQPSRHPAQDLAPPRLEPLKAWGQGHWGQGRSSALAGALWASALPAPPLAGASTLPAPPGIGRGTGIGHGVVDWGQGVQRSCAGCCRSCCAPTAAPENGPTPTPCDSRPSTCARSANHGPARAGSGRDMCSWPW